MAWGGLGSGSQWGEGGGARERERKDDAFLAQRDGLGGRGLRAGEEEEEEKRKEGTR